MTTRTVIDAPRPQDVMLELCTVADVKPVRKVRDIVDNGDAWRLAYDQCAARMQCLVWWVTSANHERPPADCGDAGR